MRLPQVSGGLRAGFQNQHAAERLPIAAGGGGVTQRLELFARVAQLAIAREAHRQPLAAQREVDAMRVQLVKRQADRAQDVGQWSGRALLAAVGVAIQQDLLERLAVELPHLRLRLRPNFHADRVWLLGDTHLGGRLGQPSERAQRLLVAGQSEHARFVTRPSARQPARCGKRRWSGAAVGTDGYPAE